MFRNILVPINGSGGSDPAIDRALGLAQRFDAAVHVVHVIDVEAVDAELDGAQRDRLHQPLERRGHEAVDRFYERATDQGIDVTQNLLEGRPSRTILEYVDDHDIDLIVMGTHGHSGPESTRLGSTTERVISATRVPVLAVPKPVDTSNGFDRIVIATDGSDIAEDAADRGIDIAAEYNASVSVIYVIDTEIYGRKDAPRSIIGLLREGGENAVATVTDEVKDRGLRVNTDLLRGEPTEEIVEYADGAGADLVVLGTRGRGGAPDAILGSTTARVLRRTSRPILAVG